MPGLGLAIHHCLDGRDPFEPVQSVQSARAASRCHPGLRDSPCRVRSSSSRFGLRGVRGPYSARILAESASRRSFRHRTGTCFRRWPLRVATCDRPRWRVPLDRGWAEVGDDRGVQGNLDPAACSPVGANRVRDARYSRACRRAAGSCIQPWHGVPPNADPAVLGRLTHSWHERRWKRACEGGGRADGVRIPERLADVPAYYADIRGGRPIPPAVLQDLVRALSPARDRDESPLNAIKCRDRAALERELADAPVFTGMKHWTPHIAEAAEAAVASGADTVVGLGAGAALLVDAIAGYRQQLERGLAAEPSSRSSGAGTTSQASSTCSLNVCAGTEAHVVFTATLCRAESSNPATPYKDQLLETSQLVAERAALEAWSFSFQSELSDGESWLGPDILDHLRNCTAGAFVRCWSARSGSSPNHLESAGTSTTRRRRWPESSDSLSKDRDAERRSGVRAGARRSGATGARAYPRKA